MFYIYIYNFRTASQCIFLQLSIMLFEVNALTLKAPSRIVADDIQNLLGRRVTWNFKLYCLWNISSAAVVFGALRIILRRVGVYKRFCRHLCTKVENLYRSVVLKPFKKWDILNLLALVLIQQTAKWWYFFLIFPRKQDLTFHANCLHWRQFAWNVKSCFFYWRQFAWNVKSCFFHCR